LRQVPFSQDASTERFKRAVRRDVSLAARFEQLPHQHGAAPAAASQVVEHDQQ